MKYGVCVSLTSITYQPSTVTNYYWISYYSYPVAVVSDAFNKNIYISYPVNNFIMKWSLVSGYSTSPSFVGNSWSSPMYMVIDNKDNIYVTDNSRVCIIPAATKGVNNVIAGNPNSKFMLDLVIYVLIFFIEFGSADGTGANAYFNNPRGIVINSGL